jgi:hypothetical protein
MIKRIKPKIVKLVVRSPGPQGPPGPSTVASSTPGPQGWSPVIAVVEDGERRVQQIVGWTGGAGTAPSTGLYIGPAGLVGDIAQATDIRGETGSGGGGGGGGNSFTTIAVSGQSSIVADSTTDTLTVVAGTAATVTTNATTDTLTVGVALGTSGATACAGNDSRLSDSRTPLAHTHPTGDITGLGGAATLNVGTTGGTVAAGNDSRFTDARTPTAHAASHASGGGDPVTIAQSQVTNLVSDLAGKAASSHTHTASQVTDFSEAVDDRVAALLVAGTNVTLSYNDAANTLTVNASGGGGGGAPTTADYLVRTADAGLSAERVVTDSTTVTANWGTSGQVAFERAALTGDVTASANSNATTISAGAVTTTKMGGDVTSAGKSLLTGADAAAQRTNLGLGGAAVLNVGTGAGTVAAGNDSRLSDARTPTAHAASHASGGGDPLTLAQSQVTSLVSDLALKAPIASPALTGTPSAPTAAADTNTTQLATCAFVQQEILNDTTKAAASHTHTASQVTDFSEAVDDKVASLLVAGSNVTLTYNDAANTLTIASTGGGGGSVATDTIWNAAGDLVVGTANDSAARLAIGARGAELYSDGSTALWRSQRTHAGFYDDFIGSNLAAEWQTGGSGGGASFIAGETGETGIYGLNTSTSSTGSRLITRGVTSILLGGGEVYVEWRAKIPTLGSGSERFNITIGLTDQVTTPFDGAVFDYADNVNSGNWVLRTTSNGSSTTSNTSTAADTGWHVYGVLVNSAANRVDFFIDGSNVGNITGTIPTGASRNTAVGCSITKSIGTTQRDLHVGYVILEHKFTSSR